MRQSVVFSKTGAMPEGSDDDRRILGEQVVDAQSRREALVRMHVEVVAAAELRDGSIASRLLLFNTA
jgi:hypothetical protein